MPGYWTDPWSCEDGGSRRGGWVAGQPGLGIRPGEGLEVAAARDSPGTTALVRRGPGELYALRHDIPRGGPQAGPIEAWVERLDPETLEPTATTRRLPAGRFWPGGIAAHANGDLYMVYGNSAHRLTPDLDVVVSHQLPVDRPYNSFVVLDSGELVMKDCHAPFGTEASTISVLDPETLLPVAEPLPLPEPVIARLSSDGESVIAVGTASVFRLRLDRDAGRVEIDDSWRPRYGPEPDRSYGWDPVITDEHVLWMDNGRNFVDRTMVDSGDSPSAVRLWWVRHDDDTPRWAEISGLPYGTVANPPGWDPDGRVVVGYDAGNAVVRGWRMAGDDLEPLWRRDALAHAGHPIVYPDTREVVVGDWHDIAALRHPRIRRRLPPLYSWLGQFPSARRASLRTGRDDLVVLDLDTGEEKARVTVPSPSQGYLFSAPGFGRDVYYQSLMAVVRVIVV